MNLYEVIKAELAALFSDSDILLTIFGGVLLYSFLYPQPYIKETVSALDVAIVDYDKSDLSRRMTFMLDASPQIKINRSYTSEEGAKEGITTGDVSALVIIPKHFKRDLYQNKQPVIAIGADASYFLIYGAVVQGAMHSILTQSAAIQIGNLLKREMPIVGAKVRYAPFSVNLISTFNVSSSYINYVIPAVYILILQQTMLIGMGILGGGFTRRMRLGEKGYFNTVSAASIMTARTLIFGSIFFVHTLFFFGFSFSFFGVPHIASIADILTFTIPFLLSVAMLGILLGTFFKGREYATPIILLTSLPLVFSAGFVWPEESMPQILVWLSALSPSTPAIQGFLRLNQMGAEFDQIMPQYILLWVQTAVFGGLAYLLLKRQQNCTVKGLK
jgi:ABC-2 type transport system permease protein